jgi:capsular exopolysaccharide synthesis family protein
LDLRAQLNLVRSWLSLLVVSFVLAGVFAYLVSGQLPKVYEARATMLVGQSLSSVNPDYTQLLASQTLSSTYSRVATTRPVLEAVISRLGLGVSPGQLLERVRADAETDSTLLTITVEDHDPVQAARIANAVAERLIATSPGLQGPHSEIQASIEEDLEATRNLITATQADIEELVALDSRNAEQERQLASLETRLLSLRSTYTTLLTLSSSSAASQLTVIEPAVASDTPVEPQPLLNAVVGSVIGLLLAAGFVSLMTYLDDRVKSAEDAQEVTGLPSLGAVKRLRAGQGRSPVYRLVTLLYPRSPATESYRTLRTNIDFASIDSPIRSLLVTSAMPGEGKTVTAANLAIAFAQTGRRVLLVDADLRKPGVDTIFNLPNDRGLTTLIHQEAASLAAVVQNTEQERLQVLTTGHLVPNPAEVLGSQRTRTIFERFLKEYELVVVDSPPVQVVADAIILSSYLDGTLLVIDAARTRRATVRNGREALAKADARVLGVVLNKLPESSTDEQVYYGEYYGALPKALRRTEAGPSTEESAR